MSSVVSPLIPFPNIWWWNVVLKNMAITFDVAEHFQKMTYRNRYAISGANGMIQLSIPLEGGRDQKIAMSEANISNSDRWQVQHWRTLTSVYKRSPYFEFYEPSLQNLFETKYDKLIDFNLATIHWLKKQLKASFDEVFTDEYVAAYKEEVTDMRDKVKANAKFLGTITPVYYQLFSDRNGFLKNLSMLDLLFSEGPHTIDWLNRNAAEVKKWND
jgi:hypothetical protein